MSCHISSGILAVYCVRYTRCVRCNVLVVIVGTWLIWVLSIPDVATAVLKSTQNSCNVYVVCKRRVIVKLAGHPQATSMYRVLKMSLLYPLFYLPAMPSFLLLLVLMFNAHYVSVHSSFEESSTSLNIHSMSHKEFEETQRSLLFDNFTDAESCSMSCSQARGSHSTSSNASRSSGSRELVHMGSVGAKTTGRDVKQSYGSHSTLKEVPYAASSSSDECQSIDEVEKLRRELKETLVMYDKACEDLVHAKKKIQVLSTECSEEAKKVEHALHTEETLKQKAADEKAKHLEAIKEVEQAKWSFTREAYSKHKAEMVGSMMSLDKEKIVDAILSNTRSCRRYSKHEIELATDNFSEARKIGEGGYGNVYRCTLDHIEVAVKVIQQDSTDKTDEFLREVEILSKLHHPNLVLLIGFCPEMGCLVYEYMENGSLEDQLLNNKKRQPLHWFLRFRIIFEVSCGLAFLHGRKPEPIVHRDLKPANILLDKNYVAKIGDAGFAKLISDLVPDCQTEYTDTIVAGTLYYMDPEYQQTGTVRPKSDLFGLGVIILQLLTGKRPHGLIVSVENAVKKGLLFHVLDMSQTDWPLAEAEMLAKLGLQCTALKCRDRPDLDSEVLPKLEEILRRISCKADMRNPKPCAPAHFICPITKEVMDDPYVVADGHTYEHYAIEAWLRKYRTSPLTRRKLPNLSIIPNHSLRAAIQQWKNSSRAEAWNGQ
ncbi:U-box domain-containing protein 34 isoform X4 [Brachypodium distachyon]|uniref:U-box domain-containing protein 34 isoform X4 n=1 Tax=Brachypodium distachyon TaxID=15368 RepID=UPI000D0CAF55|nr:U-box domain-containing protein 34 isoform X4 [Brachypodium distachyon]|eukprot:XP_024316547.1 U-box domain-containing protein 34 isoform X4 [Brachypodium distachyon]